MKKAKQILSVLLAVLMTALSVPMVLGVDIVDSGTCGDNLTWTLDNEGLLTISGEGEITESPWVSSQIKSVLIRNGVTKIGGTAFFYCSAMTTVSIPYSVTYIGDSAFYGCSALTSVTIPNSVTHIGESAFSSCSALTSITIPDSVISIGNYAFSNCIGLTSVTIGNGVTSIDSSVFKQCKNLASISISDNVTSIAYTAFGDTAYYKNSNNWENDVLYLGHYLLATNHTVKGSYAIKDGTKCIADSAFSSCSELTSLTIPNSVTHIGEEAFWYCTNLVSVTIGNSIEAIRDCAFYGCKSLTSVTIMGNSMKSIGGAAFGLCESLTSITIPDSVTTIPASVFEDTAYYNDSNNWENGALYLGHHLIEVQTVDQGSFEIKGGTKCIAESAFSSCTALTSITIPDSVISIGNYAFSSCSALTSITIPDSVISIGNYAFSNCIGLTSVTIGNGVTSIDSSVFRQCTNLTSFTVDASNPNYASDENGCLYNKDKTFLLQYPIGNTRPTFLIPDSVTSIGAFAFYDCTGLTEVTIPDSVISIGERAFYGCTGLTSVMIGNGVTSIDNYVFFGCISLSSLIIGNSVTVIDWYAFSRCKSLTKVTIPDSVTKIGMHSFSFCSNLSSLSIGNSVTSIGTCAFCDCTGLTEVTIPDYVESIGHEAFENCTGLTEVTIPYSVESIGAKAFEGCTSLNDVYYTGIEDEWNDISIGDNNTSLTDDATIHYAQFIFLPFEPNDLPDGSKWFDMSTFLSDAIAGGASEEDLAMFDSLLLSLSEYGTLLKFDFQIGDIYYIKSINKYEAQVFAEYNKYIKTVGSEHTHTLVRTDAVVSTCITPGNSAYWTCTDPDCGKYFSDANGKNEITENSWVLSTNPNNHVNTSNVAAVASTCTAKGYSAGVYCNDCKQYISGHTEQPLDPNNHVNTTNVSAVASTCTIKGYSAGMYCNDCKQYISGHTEQPLTAHQTTIINAREATYDADGYTGDTYCTVCKQTLSYGSTISKLTKTEEPTEQTEPTTQPSKPSDEKPAEKLNFFQRIIQWIRNFFAKLFGR